MSRETKEVRKMVRELQSNRCRCGNAKEDMNTFCGSCYRKLPKSMRNRLWKRIGEGYEEAYRAACAFLDDKKSDGGDEQ